MDGSETPCALNIGTLEAIDEATVEDRDEDLVGGWLTLSFFIFGFFFTGTVM